MIKLIRNILLVSASIIVAVGCSKTPIQDETNPNEITVCASSPETKAMLSESTFSTPGNRIRIYDFNPSGKYFDDLIGPDISGNTHGNTNVWPFANAPHSWTVDTHKFFGWLENDANMPEDMNTPVEFFGSGFSFNETTQVLTIPEKGMTESTPEFDFLFSNIITRDMVNAPDYGPVSLDFQHLFTSVSFSADNGSESDVTILKFQIDQILNKRAAKIDFSDDAPNITYTDANENQYLTRTSTKEYSIASGKEVYNIFDGSMNQEYMFLWPLTSAQIHSTQEVTLGQDDKEVYPSDYRMYIQYKFDDSDIVFEKRINFPDMALEAGKRNNFTISFADKSVELKTHVQPWIHDAQVIDYENTSVTVPSGGVLEWDDQKSTLGESEGEKLVFIKNGQPAEAHFTIGAPLGGTWLISLSGDIDAFRVDPDSGEINGSTAHIRVVPLIEDPKREYKVKLKFAVRRPDGRIIAADELVQPKTYKRAVVLSPM